MTREEIKKYRLEIETEMRRLKREAKNLQRKCRHPKWRPLINQDSGDMLFEMCVDCKQLR